MTLLIKSLLDSDVRLSLDASALVPDVLPLLPDKNVVVTPHAGEFKRLFGILPPASKKDRISLVEKNAKIMELLFYSKVQLILFLMVLPHILMKKRHLQ